MLCETRKPEKTNSAAYDSFQSASPPHQHTLGLHQASGGPASSASVSQPSRVAWSLNAASSFGAFGWSSWMSPISDSTRLKPLRSWVCKTQNSPSECPVGQT